MNFYNAGRRLKSLRQNSGLTQAALAEKVGLSTNYYGSIERGEKTPQLDTMVRIVNVFDASLDDILSDQLNHGMTVQANRLSVELEGLSPADQAYILSALEAMIQTARGRYLQ